MRKRSYKELCQNWEIDPEKYRDLFEWLKDDPRDEEGRLTRGVGLRKPGGIPEKLVLVHSMAGLASYSLDDRMWNMPVLFPRCNGAVKVLAVDFDFY